MTALSPYERTILSRHFTRRTASFIGDSTEPTYLAIVVGHCIIIVVVVVVACIPSPLCNGVPVFDTDFHR
ncbi:hypothetical protein PISMIDRAFT_690347, partial [Pisolithus microcarpus 441]